MLQPFCKSKNGVTIYLDPVDSHAATHIKDDPKLPEYLKQILENKEIAGEEEFEVDMGFIVGNMDLVETNENDDVFYAKRYNRDKYTRFVRNRSSIPTSKITVIIRKTEAGEYFVYTVYVGVLTPTFPGGDDEQPDSKEYWSKHAFVLGTQEFRPETETRERPW